MAGKGRHAQDKPYGSAGQGNPGKYTAATLKKLRMAIEAGMSQKRACRVAGISHETLRLWREDPRKADALTALIEEAEAAFEQRMLQVIDKAATENDQWQAAAWRLERKWPEDFGRRDTVKGVHEHSGPAGAPIPIQYFDADAALAAVAAGSGDGSGDA